MKTTTLTAVFTHFDNSSNWVHGICGEYNFDAKLFDDGSQFGINNGRVSKLSIAKYNGSPDVNYDRGWDLHVLPMLRLGDKEGFDKCVNIDGVKELESKAKEALQANPNK